MSGGELVEIGGIRGCEKGQRHEQVPFSFFSRAIRHELLEEQTGTPRQTHARPREIDLDTRRHERQRAKHQQRERVVVENLRFNRVLPWVHPDEVQLEQIGRVRHPDGELVG